MNDRFPNTFTSFDGHSRIAAGPLPVVVVKAKRALESGAAGPVLIFDDRTGRPIDVDTRGSDEEVVARTANLLAADPNAEATSFSALPNGATDAANSKASENPPRGRGRPRLGVVAREVTLLPRQWEWLATQPGGASVALRKLVDEARRVRGDKDRTRCAQDRAYQFMSAMAGDLAGFEDAARALFAGDLPRLKELIAAWPSDVRDHVAALAGRDAEQMPR